MSPSLSHYLGFGVLMNRYVEVEEHRARDILRDDNCYDYVHHHPEWDFDWSERQKEQFEQEHKDEIEVAKAKFEDLSERYLENIEVQVAGVMNYTQNVVIYAPTLQSGYEEPGELDLDRIGFETDDKRQVAVEQIERYLALFDVSDEDIEQGPTWMIGSSYW